MSLRQPAIRREPRNRLRIAIPLLLACLCGRAAGQAQNGNMDAFLELIGEEKDPARKLALLEEFERRNPKHNGPVSVYSQMQELYIYGKQYAKAIEMGEKLLQSNPEDLEAAEGCWAAAEGLGDKTLTAKWAEVARETAQLVAQSPPPKENDPESLDYWNKRVEQARQTLQSFEQSGDSEEYNIYVRALKTADMRGRIALLDELEKKYPDHKYKQDALLLYYIAYRRLGDKPRALHAAERFLIADPGREDLLLYVADAYFQQNAEPGKVVRLSQQMLELMRTKAKPAQLGGGEWETQKRVICGLAHWMIGSVALRQDRYAEAGRSLRLALPFAQGNPALTAGILSSLGWADYQQHNLSEALGNFGRCVLIPTRYQEYCAKNVEAIKTELGARK